MSTPATVRATAPLGAIPEPGGLSQGPPPPTIHDEVGGQQHAGRQQIGAARKRLEGVTDGAKGASAEAADAVKEWKPNDQ